MTIEYAISKIVYFLSFLSSAADAAEGTLLKQKDRQIGGP